MAIVFVMLLYLGFRKPSKDPDADKSTDRAIAIIGTIAGCLHAYGVLASHRQRSIDTLDHAQHLIRFEWNEIYEACIRLFVKAQREFSPDVVICLSEVAGMAAAFGIESLREETPILFCVWQEKKKKAHVREVKTPSRWPAAAPNLQPEHKDDLIFSKNYAFLKDSHFPLEVSTGVILVPNTVLQLKGKKILIVDERSRTGATMESIYQFFKTHGFNVEKDLRFMVIWESETQRHQPSFAAFQTQAKDLIVPWGNLK